MLQAGLFDGLAFDHLSLFGDGFRSGEVSVSRCDVLQASFHLFGDTIPTIALSSSE